ncbi:MAG: thermonuclease family protein [Thermoproteota archaeon]|jgi:micrococcal nuclease|nr:thermonuclease family protein [Thermoproteota archaeon]MEE3213696.1 thermonuclease family protein [Thermoproteota archaeon]|tara:strand:- start:2859 stop:3332 length:474 start_codon:yes stop_codon:yes gene_type:complete
MKKNISVLAVSALAIAFIVFAIQNEPEQKQSSYCDDKLCISGTVARIIDGDTIDILSSDDSEIRIRLALVDTPERGEEGYQEAREFTASICPIGTELVFEPDIGQPEGSYGRAIGLVSCGGISLNELLLRTDHAILYERFCNVSEFGDKSWAKEFGC